MTWLKSGPPLCSEAPVLGIRKGCSQRRPGGGKATRARILDGRYSTPWLVELSCALALNVRRRSSVFRFTSFQPGYITRQTGPLPDMGVPVLGKEKAVHTKESRLGKGGPTAMDMLGSQERS